MSVHNSGMETETGREPDAERERVSEAERMGQQRPRRKGPEGRLLLVIRWLQLALRTCCGEAEGGRQRGCTGSIINEDQESEMLVKRDQLWRV